MFRFLVILLFVVMKCDSRCTYEGIYVQCDSIKGAKEDGDHRNWKSLLLKSFGGQQTIDAHFLQQIPNVTSLIFENSVISIEENAFIDGSTTISYLTFKKCDLPLVKTKWFSNTSVRKLSIQESKLTTLKERCFDGLETLGLYGNNITRINANVLNGTSIETLYLNSNQIRVIEKNALANITKLVEIELNGNLLTSFNSEQIVGTKTLSLKYLFLQNNQIKYLDEHSFVMFPNIQSIYLNSNELELIEDGTFGELYQLEYLNLAFNKLKSFTERVLPYDGLPHLRYLDLHGNLLNYLPLNFIRNFPKLRIISIFPNPWQCACYKQILHNLLVYHKYVSIKFSEIYLNGERPVCYVPETNSDKCSENIENNDDLIQIFVERLKEYR